MNEDRREYADAGVSASVAQHYGRNSAIAAVVVITGWHLGFDLPGLLSSPGDYTSFAVPLAAWLLYTAIGVGCAVPILRRGRGPTRVPALILALAALAIAAAVLAACPPGSVITPANWGWGSVGWLGVLICWSRPARDLIAVLTANALIMLAGMIAKGVDDRGSLASYLMVIVGSMALQLGFSLGVHALARTGDWVSARSRDLADAAAERASTEAVYTARVERSQAVHQDTIRLLDELTAGADPTDPVIRRRGAIAAARMRRLLAETADGEEPLLDELRACADIADRTGIVVELESHGRVPVLSASVRRALAEAPIMALTSAATYARVTVTGLEDEVIVSVLCDAPAIELPISSGVTITRYNGGTEQWIDSRWPSQ